MSTQVRESLPSDPADPAGVAETAPAFSRAVYAVAAASTLVLLAYADRYGPHRDELYFIAAGHRLQWGYPDQPPLTPFVALLADRVAHGSLLVLRLIPALVVGVIVLLNAGLARELGGDRRAQLVTAVTVAFSAGLLAVGHLLSTATLDALAGTVVIWLTVRVLHRDEPRGWLLVGLAAGLGLENKSLVAPLLAALVIGIAVTPSVRQHFRSPWAVVGAVVTLLLWSPNVWWQAAHGWPQYTLAADIHGEYGTIGGLASLILLQLIMLSPLGTYLAGTGLLALIRRPEWQFARPVAIAYPIFLLLLVVSGGKAYYTIAMLGPLAAAGAVVLVGRWTSRRTVVFTTALALIALFPIPALLPVLPAKTFANSFYPSINDDELDTIGWPGFVDQVNAVITRLPAAQQRTAVLVTGNYGEAGALLWYGTSLPVYSGHNGFGDWGPPVSTGPVVLVDEQTPNPAAFQGCQRAATLKMGVDNEEDGAGVWICTGPVGSWAQAWPLIRHLSA